MKLLLRNIFKTPVVTESGRPSVDEHIEMIGGRIHEKVRKQFGRSLHIREVDPGSCNGCELEIAGLNSPYYDLERFGLQFVASPRHADCLLVTGPVTRNMADPLDEPMMPHRIRSLLSPSGTVQGTAAFLLVLTVSSGLYRPSFRSMLLCRAALQRPERF